MASDHVDELFSIAVDDELSAPQSQRFHRHLATCARCAQAYDSFRSAVQSVRALPPARMPLPVHLPSTSPGPERGTAAAWLRGLRRRWVVPGSATALAGAGALVIVLIALTRSSGTPNVTLSSGGGGAANSQSAACVQRASGPATLDTGTYTNRATKTDPSRPGQTLVLATDASTVSAGGQVVVYADLSVPVPVAGAPGAPASSAAASVVPCLSLTGLPQPAASALTVAPAPAGAYAPMAGAPQPAQGSAAQAPPASALPLRAFTVPPGTPPGTVLHIVATVPGGFPDAGQQFLSVELTITVR